MVDGQELLDSKITAASFEVVKCSNRQNRVEKEYAYKVKISFLNHTGAVVSTSKMLIKPEIGLTLSDKPVIDVYSYNGITGKTLFHSQNFSNGVSKECQKTTEAAKQYSNKDGQVLFVLDIKDEPQETNARSYKDKGGIIATEQAFVTYLQEEKVPDGSEFKHARTFKKHLMKASPDYLMLEGRLKAEIIQHFTSEQQTFMQTKGEGVSVFCQLTEFLLNAFKRGETANFKSRHQTSLNITRTSYSRHDFFIKLNPEAPDYQPTNDSTTIYPPFYTKIATQGMYTQAMQQSGFFKLSLRSESNGVVHMNTSRVDLTS
ncbi:hypothetical protein [Legionella impletisoli]|uniref:Uncharacterized protein n=1 Tax=Legionella impletisoli TaxID=343510 RepID=A0A917JRW3_9GAMM|nr:hypothetical protein [Legionella impletisoli]GGI82423.1 hypothetical protein GCM10007966_08770 [Legionella impletisoli]